MPRGYRISGGHDEGGVLHLTHRCHNRAFLLKFKTDRDRYRSLLREHLRVYGVSMLDYCITSNHVHLLVDGPDRLEVAAFMRDVASEFARGYNRRKKRSNAFWGDNYHATLVEDGQHLWECLCYIELNMVRCGAVAHPREWDWVGLHEMVGTRRRYRVIDPERLCWRLRAGSMEELRQNLAVSLAERIAQDRLRRESCWTESLAVGSREFVERMQPRITSRRQTETVATGAQTWALREEPSPYDQETSPKIAANGNY